MTEIDKRITTKADVARIVRCPSERRFAKFLLQTNPGLIIEYEPEIFSYVDENGKLKLTIPDFVIINPRQGESARKTYVEITLAQLNGSDPKARQKEVMKNAAPDIHYTVLYAHNLKSVQKAHPKFRPYGSS